MPDLCRMGNHSLLYFCDFYGWLDGGHPIVNHTKTMVRIAPLLSYMAFRSAQTCLPRNGVRMTCNVYSMCVREDNAYSFQHEYAMTQLIDNLVPSSSKLLLGISRWSIGGCMCLLYLLVFLHATVYIFAPANI
jgi:hypothetical protein